MTYELDTVYLRIKSPFVLVPEPKMKRSLSRKYHHVFAACSSYSWQERPRHSLSLFINLYYVLSKVFVMLNFLAKFHSFRLHFIWNVIHPQSFPGLSQWALIVPSLLKFICTVHIKHTFMHTAHFNCCSWGEYTCICKNTYLVC